MPKLSGLFACAALLVVAAAPVRAQFIGEPFWLSDPTGSCSYVGTVNCPLAAADDPYPRLAVPENGASGSIAAATATATLAAVAAKTTYLSHFDITGGGATAASVVACTVSGVLGGTETVLVGVPAGATAQITPLVYEYSAPLVASAVDTAIVVSCPSFGAGNTAASVNAGGYVR